MRRAISLWTAVWITAFAGILAVQAQTPPADVADAAAQATATTDPPNPPPLLTIAKRQHSGWGHANPLFSGADFVIRNPDA